MQVEFLLPRESEMDPTEQVTQKDVGNLIGSLEEDIANTEDSHQELPFRPLREQLRILASAHVKMSKYETSGGGLRGLRKAQPELRCQVERASRQTRIGDFLRQSSYYHTSGIEKPLYKGIVALDEAHSYSEVRQYHWNESGPFSQRLWRCSEIRKFVRSEM